MAIVNNYDISQVKISSSQVGILEACSTVTREHCLKCFRFPNDARGWTFEEFGVWGEAFDCQGFGIVLQELLKHSLEYCASSECREEVIL